MVPPITLDIKLCPSDFNNGLIIQTVDITTINGQLARHTYPISFKYVVWPIVSGHFQSNMGITLDYDLTGVDCGYLNYLGGHYGNSIVMGF